MSEQEQSLFSLFHIGISIHTLNRQSEKDSGLSLVQWCLLKCLIDMPAASAHSLSTAVGVHPSTLTQTLKRLERKKYIFITEDPKDSRKKLISITRVGKEAMENTSVRMGDWSQNLSLLGQDLHRVRSFLQAQVNQGA